MIVSEKLMEALFDAGKLGEQEKFLDAASVLVNAIGVCGSKLKILERDHDAMNALRLTDADVYAGPMSLHKEGRLWHAKGYQGARRHQAFDPADAILGDYGG